MNRSRLALAVALVLVLAAGRAPAALLTVTNTNDAGAGSLRAAIQFANDPVNDPANTIWIIIPGDGPHVITLSTALPAITKPLYFIGDWEAVDGVPMIQLDGSAVASGDGLSFSSGATGSTVQYLSITGFPGDGIEINASSVQVVHSYVGVATDGTTAAPNGTGIRVSAASVTIGGDGAGNVISGNTNAGVSITSSASSASVVGNKIGTDADGLTAVANGGSGVEIYSDANTVGSTSADGRNLLSGNTWSGVYLSSTADSNLIYGNFIGVDAAGTAAIPNGYYGVNVGGSTNTIGGDGTIYRNVISGNSGGGVLLGGSGTANTVSGNYIGVDKDGTTAIANDGGVTLDGTGNTVGGDTAGKRNVISGNTYGGIAISGTGHLVRNNYIGTDAAGTAAVPNGSQGIRALVAADGTIRENLISGNSVRGVVLDDDSSGFSIVGNKIGTDAAGTSALPNGETGILLYGTAHSIGDGTAGGRNVVSGNAGTGLSLSGSDHSVLGNYFGTNGDGTAALGNGGNGISVHDTGQEIGNGTAGGRNVISGNGSAGISLDGAEHVVVGNYIGLNAAGTAALGNTSAGVRAYGTAQAIGDGSAGGRNVISGNGSHGIYMNGTGHTVLGNYIGTNAAGTAALGNGSYGIRADTVSNVFVGGYQVADGNVLAGNARGVLLGYGSHDVFLLNNILGLDATATSDITTGGTGVEIDESWDNTIGLPGEGNVIAGFQHQGIRIDGRDSYGNVIQGNWIGTNKALANGLGNDFSGIFVGDSSDNLIGGTGAGEGNVIANNYQFGVRVDRGDRNEISGNSIWGNYFGIDIDLLGFFPNDGGDGDGGGNQTQNYPLLASAMVNGGSTDIDGMVISEPGTQYRIEFFSGTSCLPLGFGDGRTFRGSTLVTTDGGGQKAFSYALPQAIGDAFLTATLTDPLGNTSEFSPCVAIDQGEAPGTFQFDRGAYVGYEGVLPTTQVFVLRSLGLSGSVTVDLDTIDFTAFAGSDYTDSDQTLTFQPWEVVKVVDVPILFDPAPEAANEKLLLDLSNPTGGSSLGAQASSELQIWDYDEGYPGITVSDARVDEGDGGTTTLTFEVHLSATDHPVTVTYLVEPGTATPDVDYLADSDILSFIPSGSPQTEIVEVQVVGDTDVEPNESVWLRITTASGGGTWIAYDTYGLGEIRNDDFSSPPPSNVIFADGFEIGSPALWSATSPAP